MNSFEELNQLGDKAMEALLREVPRERFVMAVKGASPELADRWFNNITDNAQRNIREDLRIMVSTTDEAIKASQAEVLSLANRLQNEGKLPNA